MSSTSLSDINILLIVTEYVKYAYIGLLIIGVIGNILNILIFTNLRIFRQHQCAFYLNIESIVNIVALVYFFVDRITQYSDGYDLADYSITWCRIRAFLDQITQLIPFSIICFTAFDQILSTSHWYTLRQMSTLKLAQYLIFVIICLSSIHSVIPIWWLFIIPPIGCISDNTILLNYYLYFYYPILVGILPIFIASLFSLIAFRNVRKIIRRQIPIIRRRLDRQLTAMVFIRIIIFTILYLPYVVYRIFTLVKIANLNYDIPFLFDQLMQISVIFLKNINYAVRFSSFCSFFLCFMICFFVFVDNILYIYVFINTFSSSNEIYSNKKMYTSIETMVSN